MTKDIFDTDAGVEDTKEKVIVRMKKRGRRSRVKKEKEKKLNMSRFFCVTVSP